MKLFKIRHGCGRVVSALDSQFKGHEFQSYHFERNINNQNIFSHFIIEAQIMDGL